VEDTYNLLGHALRKALGVIARSSGRELASVAAETKAEWVAGSSLKAALDLDWDDPVAKVQALCTILTALNEVESWLQNNSDLDAASSTQAQESLAVGRQIQAQDVEEASDGSQSSVGEWQKTVASRLKMDKCVTDVRVAVSALMDTFVTYSKI